MNKLTGLEKFLIISKNQTSIFNIIKFVKTSIFFINKILDHPDVITAEYEEKLINKLT
jgi:hypothetical protein